MRYIEHTTDAEAEQAESDRIRRIHKRVKEVRASEETGVRYMQAWEERYFDRQESREEGREELLKELIWKKMQKGKTAEEIAEILEEDKDTVDRLMLKIKKESNRTGAEE